MDNKILVETQIQEGKLFLTKLDEAALEIKAAFWLYEEESASWKYMIASSSETLNVKKDTLQAYRTVTNVMRTIPELSFISSSDVVILPLDHPLIKNIAPLIRTDSGIADVRFSNTLLNNLYVEGMHLYRMNVS